MEIVCVIVPEQVLMGHKQVVQRGCPDVYGSYYCYNTFWTQALKMYLTKDALGWADKEKTRAFFTDDSTRYASTTQKWTAVEVDRPFWINCEGP